MPDQAVVFDIDGTLTPKPIAIYSAREDAAQAAQLYAQAGYKIVYLSARTPLLQSGIPKWLKANGFPEGSIHLTQSRADRSDHAAFKQRVLQQYAAKGWHFVAAYGDSSTDFVAYGGAGIDKRRIFALKRVGQAECQPGGWVACYSSWAEQLESIVALLRP